MDRGQSGSLNFKIDYPQQRQAQMGPSTMQPVAQQDPTFELPDKLAIVQDKTSNLFKNYGALQSFVKTMQQQGIDPFKPDYTQEDGGMPYQTYLELDASVRLAADELKNEKEFRDQLNPYRWQNKAGYAPGINPESDMVSQDPNSVISYEQMPFVEQANQRLNTPTYTQGDQSKFNQAHYDPTIQHIDQMVQSGQMTQAEGEMQKANLQRNVAQTSYQQLIPRGGSRGGLSQEDVQKRAELIKQVKGGIITQDQTPLNMLRLIPGVEDVEYVNTGAKVGLQVYFKGGQPAFVDLSQGAGEGDINALLNRIEGQKNVPNEAVFSFDTKVNIPKSNSGEIITNIKSKVAGLPDNADSAKDILPKLQELAAQGDLEFDEGLITSINVDEPWIYGKNKVIVEYHPIDANGKVNYAKTRTKKIEDPAELEALVDQNANVLAPAFGGGFVQNEQPVQETPAQKALREYRERKK